MDDEKSLKFGVLDQVARLLEDVVPHYARLYETGNFRMRPDEIKRIAGYLSRIRASHSLLRDTLKLFEAIAERPDAAELLERIARAQPHEKNIQNAAVQLSTVETNS